jgi:MFS family permease
MKTLMMAAFGGGVGAVAGAILSYFAAVALVEFLPSDGPDFRTGSAFFAFFLAIFGGIAGLIAGVIFGVMAQAGHAAAFWKGVGVLAGMAVALVLAGGLVLLARQDRPARISGKVVDLEYEFRLPRGFAWPPAETSPTRDRVVFYRPKFSVEYPLDVASAKLEDGHWVLRGRFPMDVTPRDMTLSFYLADSAVGHFGLDPRTPEPVDLDWFRWVGKEGSFSFRYRYQFRK